MRASKDNPQGIFLSYVQNLMKGRTGVSYLVMKSNPIVTGDRTLMEIGYRYNSRKVLGFIVTEGTGSTEPGDPYLSSFPG